MLLMNCPRICSLIINSFDKVEKLVLWDIINLDFESFRFVREIIQAHVAGYDCGRIKALWVVVIRNNIRQVFRLNRIDVTSECSKVGEQTEGRKDRLLDELEMLRDSVVHLKSRKESSLRKEIWIEVEEGIIMTD